MPYSTKDEEKAYNFGFLIVFIPNLLGYIILGICWSINASNNWKDGYASGQADVIGGKASIVVEKRKQIDSSEQWEIVKELPKWKPRNYRKNFNKEQ